MINEETCGCKSGLLLIKCCGRDSFPLSASGEEVVSWLSQAKVVKDSAVMNAMYCNVLDREPLNAEALKGILAYAFNDNALTFKLEHLLKTYDKKFASNVWAKLHLIVYALYRGDFENCYPLIKAVLRRKPDSAQGHLLAGRYFSERKFIDDIAAIYHFRKAKELGLDNPGVNTLLASVLMKNNQLTESKACYLISMKRDDNCYSSLLGLAKASEYQSEFDNAWQFIDQMSQSDTLRSDCLLLQAKLYRREGKYDQAVQCLEQSASKDSHSTTGYWYEMGRIHDRLQNHEEAMQAFVKANQIARSHSPAYKKSEVLALHDKLKVFFKRERLINLPRLERDIQVTQPLFIFGFPRSGTTLTEHILTSHSQIKAGGELPFVADLTRTVKNNLESELVYPGCLMDLALGDKQNAIASMQADYLAKANLRGLQHSNVQYFTDKMPLNETHLGLIDRIFPRSPKVHLIRHPLDVVLSNFFTELTHGYHQGQDLVTAAQHYVSTMDLVFHYRRELDSNCYTLRYEELIDDIDGGVRDLLNYIDLPFEKQCLDFHQNKSHTKTASYAQVTQPLYSSSKFRYKSYLKYLEPVICELEGTIKKLGYCI